MSRFAVSGNSASRRVPGAGEVHATSNPGGTIGSVGIVTVVRDASRCHDGSYPRRRGAEETWFRSSSGCASSQRHGEGIDSPRAGPGTCGSSGILERDRGLP